MNKKKVWFCCLLASLWMPSTVALCQNASDVVAEVNGTKITRAELEKEQAGKLLQIRYQTFMTEQKVLMELIEHRLLAMEAARQHLTVEQLMDREINSKVKNPSEDQLQFLYEQSNANEPYEAVRGKLLDLVHQHDSAKVKAVYVQKLGSQSNVFISLAPPVAEVAVGDSPLLGAPGAPVQLIEFADYECPYCAKVHPYVMKLHEEFGDQLAIYFKDMPLPMHQRARKAAEAARCAEAQGKFWEYHDRLFSSTMIEVPQLKKYAREFEFRRLAFRSVYRFG